MNLDSLVFSFNIEFDTLLGFNTSARVCALQDANEMSINLILDFFFVGSED